MISPSTLIKIHCAAQQRFPLDCTSAMMAKLSTTILNTNMNHFVLTDLPLWTKLDLEPTTKIGLATTLKAGL